MLDCIYVAASTLDARFTRICVASIRRVCPSVPVKLLIGGPLQAGLIGELSRHFDVVPAEIPRGPYGWGFVKLEPLFGRPGERFLILDSDTVLTGPMTAHWGDASISFVVDDEDYAPETIPSRYYDWRQLRRIDPQASEPALVFNSGQWVGTSGVLSRSDFDPWLEWSFPRRHRHASLFFPGEQGVLNYVVSKAQNAGRLTIDRRPLMHWPGRGMQGLTAASIKDRTAPPVIIHWAGMKSLRQSQMVGSDILTYFEDLYYAKIPAGSLRRRLAAATDAAAHLAHGFSVRARLTLQKIGNGSPADPIRASRA